MGFREDGGTAHRETWVGVDYIWELPGNYPVFIVVMEIYHYVE